MATYVMLTRLAPDKQETPEAMRTTEQKVMKLIRSECPEVEWRESLAVLGPWDYLDVFEAPDTESAMKVSTLIRTFGHAETEVWPAAGWSRFKELIDELPKAT